MIVSGEDIKRPSGISLNTDGKPTFGREERLDFEVEVGFVIGKDSRRGLPVGIDEADDYVFGIVLLNDWSARKIQAFEYQPLGPFNGKSFATTISPWVIPLECIRRKTCPTRESDVADYLNTDVAEENALDLDIETVIRDGDGKERIVSRTNASHLYWNYKQMVAHQTINGCNLRNGDIIATGTISGPTDDSLGSLLEITKGKGPFLQDGDCVRMTGMSSCSYCGSCEGRIVS